MDLGGTLRALRRTADLSQRQLAVRAGIPLATVGHIEAGRTRDPSFRTVARLVRAAGGTIALTAADGAPPRPIDTDNLRDEGGRRYPAHLDVRPVLEATDWRGAWWAYCYKLPRDRWPRQPPTHTFDRNRQWRNIRRRMAAGTQELEYQHIEVHPLAPGDESILALLARDGADFDLGGRAAVDRIPLDPVAATRYLADPSVRHWIATFFGEVVGYLVAYVQCRHHAASPSIALHELGVRAAWRDQGVDRRLLEAFGAEDARLNAERPNAGETTVRQPRD
jgi:transcriptional regulator with XRE-family HTH domain